MYHFAIVALMALAIVKVVDFVTDNVEALNRFRSLLTFVLGIVAVMWLDYSLFEGWQIGIDERDSGVLMTGFVVTGMTVPWRALFGYLTHDRANTDETLGAHVPMIRKAA